MNKKFMNALLFSAALLSSGVVVTSCKDYDDDINELRDMIGDHTSLTDALQTQLNTLEKAAQTAQSTAETAQNDAQTAISNAQKAQDAADAAQARGDEALAAAQQAQADADSAKAQAALAQEAVATAKQEAIEAAKADLEAYKADVVAALANKVDNTKFDSLQEEVSSLGKDLQEELNELVGRIEGIETGLADEITSALNLRITANEGNIRNLQDALATLAGGESELDVQLATLENYAKLLSDSGLKQDIADVDAKVEEAKTSIQAIQLDITGIKSQITTNEGNISTIQKYIDDTLKPKLQTLDNSIRDINSDLSQLHVLIAARLSSITFAPDYFVDGIEAIVFNSLEYGDMKDKGEDWDLVKDILPAQYSTAALATASYHFNPASFKLSNADYQYIDRQVEVINTRSAVAATKLLEIEGEPMSNVEKGTVEFKLRRLDTPNTGSAKDKVNTVALQATLKGDAVDKSEANSDVVITSPYVRVYDDVVNQADLFISDKESLETVGDAAHFATTVTAAQAEDPRYEVIYDKDFNLKELIATCVNKEDDPSDLHNALALDDYKLSYRFSVATTEYKITTGSTETNQQTVIQCKDAEEGVYAITDGFGRETIGRTPILRVELVDESGRVLRRGFVKVKVVAEKSADYVAGTVENMIFGCADDVTNFELDEEWMRENVYRQITSSRGDVSMSHEEFWNMYELDHTEVTKNGVPFSGTAPQVVDGSASAGVATKKVVWNIHHSNLGTIGANGSTFFGSVVLKNKLEASEFPEYVTLTMTINVTLPQLGAEFTKNELYWNADQSAFVSNVNRPASETDYAENCQFETKLADAFTNITFDAKLPECRAGYYRVAGIYNGEKKLADGVEINGNTAADQIITLDKNNAAIKDALNNGAGLFAIVEYVVEFESGDVVVAGTFNVEFVTPVSLNMPTGKSVVDAKTGGDVVDFSGYQMLTDWRGYTITSPETTEQLVQWGFWKHNPSNHEVTVIPGWNEVVTPAYWDIQLKDVQILSGEKVYGGSVEVTYRYRLQNGPIQWGTREVTKTYTVDNSYESEAAVQAVLNSMVTAGIDENRPADQYGIQWTYTGNTVGYPTYTEGVAMSVTTVKAIESMEYHPEVTVAHDPQIIVNRDHLAARPNREGTQDGEIVGCWQWIAKENTQIVTTYGAYWDFYGVFGELKLDVANATTNLEYNGGKLPSNVTLTQVGNTVKYENIGTPVGYSYEIYIPASISYGWGTAETTLTITVNPAGK